MKCYIRNSSSFAVEAQRDTDDYSLVIDSMSVEKGSVTLLSEDAPSALKGKWFLLNGELWRIDTVSPGKGKTKLSLLPIDSLFNRTLLYTTSSAATVGAFIASVITSEWINQTDTAYQTSYISVTSTDTTPFIAPQTNDDGTFNFQEYIRQMRNDYNIVIHAVFSGNTLALTISRDTPTVHPLVLNDGHTQLISSDFKASALSKVTVFYKADDETVTATNWYLASDGTVSSTVPQTRAEGEWGSISISGDDDPQTKATEEFSNNESSRKIELFSDVNMSVGDSARLRINGEIIEATVTGIYRKRGEIRTRYKLGDLATTLTEQLKAVAVKAESGGGSSRSDLPAWTGGSY